MQKRSERNSQTTTKETPNISEAKKTQNRTQTQRKEKGCAQWRHLRCLCARSGNYAHWQVSESKVTNP